MSSSGTKHPRKFKSNERTQAKRAANKLIRHLLRYGNDPVAKKALKRLENGERTVRCGRSKVKNLVFIGAMEVLEGRRREQKRAA